MKLDFDMAFAVFAGTFATMVAYEVFGPRILRSFTSTSSAGA